MAEELGFVAIAVFLTVLVLWISRMLRISRSAPDDFGRLLAAGIAAWVAIQSFCNIGSMVGVLPLTGLPLPFVSYGGSSTMMLLAAMGILTNISAHATIEPVLEPARHQ